jgi:hypothetical protein
MTSRARLTIGIIVFIVVLAVLIPVVLVLPSLGLANPR